MDGYKDGDRQRSDALEITRPLVRGSRNPLHKTPPVTPKLRNLTNHTTTHINFNSFRGPSPEVTLKFSALAFQQIHKLLFAVTECGNQFICRICRKNRLPPSCTATLSSFPVLSCLWLLPAIHQMASQK